MIADKIKFFQGYVRVRLTGYAPERFLNLCSNRKLLIWNLESVDGQYEFCMSLYGFRQLKPLLKKTRTKVRVLERHGLPFLLHRYRKHKVFLGGITLCAACLYVLSLFIWNIEIDGNVHRTDEVILKFLEENKIQQGILRQSLDCSAIEELLRSGYEDIIWASAEIKGTRLLIHIQENLASGEEEDAEEDTSPSSLVAEKEAEIYSILTRSGTPYVEQGSQVQPGDMLVEGILPIYDDNGEVASYQYCRADADILGITWYTYEDSFSMEYEDKVWTGRSKNSYQLQVLGRCIRLPEFGASYEAFDTVTEELPLRLGENFYLPVLVCRSQELEYEIQQKTYTDEEARALAEDKLEEFCQKLTQTGVQILENHVMIVTENKTCQAYGKLKLVEPLGERQSVDMTQQQEGQKENESDGNNR